MTWAASRPNSEMCWKMRDFQIFYNGGLSRLAVMVCSPVDACEIPNKCETTRLNIPALLIKWHSSCHTATTQPCDVLLHPVKSNAPDHEGFWYTAYSYIVINRFHKATLWGSPSVHFRYAVQWLATGKISTLEQSVNNVFSYHAIFFFVTF